MMQTQTTLSIDDMIRLDPRIGELLNEANIPAEQGHWHRYSHYKRLLSQHVGMDAHIPTLQSAACYETVIAALVEALPQDTPQEGKEHA